MIEWLPFEFGRPWVLLVGAAAIAATVFIARDSLAGQSALRKRISTGIRILLIVILTLSLADFRLTRQSDKLTVLFLVDSSDSISTAEYAQLRSFIYRTC